MSKELDKAIARFQNTALAILDNGLQTIDAINSGLGIIADAQHQARCEMRAAEYTNCKACQAALVLFIKDTPDADNDTLQSVTETLWQTCPPCSDEYAAYLDSITCKHGVQNWENCDACLDEWANANAPECDGILDKASDWEVQHGLS